MLLARQIFDGADRNAVRIAQIDQKLRQAVMLAFDIGVTAEQAYHIVHYMSTRGPNFPAVDQPAAICPGRLGADRGQIRARIRFTHADAKKNFAFCDARNDALLHLLGAESQY